MKWLLFLVITILLFTPFTFLRSYELKSYTRGIIYFAIVWPIITATVYLGASSQRHLYLASVGPCVALGLAAARLITAKHLFPVYGSTVAAFLFFGYGLALASGVAGFALNGNRSLQLRQQVDKVIEHASQDKNTFVIVIPEIPDNHRVFWEYFYPVAIQPPFTQRIHSVSVISSFTSCHCPPEEWMSEHHTSLMRIIHGPTGPIYVVEWDTQQSVFVTHMLNQEDFLKAGYLAPNGSFLRSRQLGEASIVLP